MNGRKERRELELKLEMPSPDAEQNVIDLLASRGYRLAKLKPVLNEDLYLDTFEWTLLGNKRSLRLRSADGGKEYTLKSIGTIEAGVADREEMEIAVSKPLRAPTDIPVKKLRTKITDIIWPRKLIEQLLIRTERQRYHLTCPDGSLIELAFDVSSFSARGLNKRRKTARLYEFEAELASGAPRSLEELGAVLRGTFELTPSRVSKLERAIEALKIDIPSKKPPPELRVRLDDRFDAAVAKILRFQLQRFDTYLQGVQLDIDTEFVHQARVATRRMRSALQLFKGALPQKTVDLLRAELGWLGAVFGEVRDLDVLLLNLPKFTNDIETPNKRHRGTLERWIETHRIEPLENLKQSLRSVRFTKFRTRIQRFIDKPLAQRPTAPLALVPVRRIAPEIVTKKYDAVIARGRKVTAKPKLGNFHKLRIQVKKLRYACEFMDPAYRGDLKAFIKKTVRIQDCLGEMQDTVFTRSFIDFILGEWKNQVVAPGMLFMLGEIYQHQGEIARLRQAEFGDIWREFDTEAINDELQSILNPPAPQQSGEEADRPAHP
jgi:CHAD domain-containing protein